MYGNMLSAPSFSPGFRFKLQMGMAENCFVLCQFNPAWFHFRRFGGNSLAKKKKKDCQDSAGLGNNSGWGDCQASYCTKSLGSTEAMIMSSFQMLPWNAVAQKAGLAMPCSHASFEFNQMCTYCMYSAHMQIQNHKQLSFEHAQRSVGNGEVFRADGYDPRHQSVSHSNA